MLEISIHESVREQLRVAMLEEAALVTAIRQAHSEKVPGHPERLRCLCTVAVRRPSDPETAALCQVEVVMEQTGSGLEVVLLEGLADAT